MTSETRMKPPLHTGDHSRFIRSRALQATLFSGATMHTKNASCSSSPDSYGEVRPNCEDHAVEVWRTATRLHFNLDFRVNSQPLAACMTPDPVLGGRAPAQDEWQGILALWANCTLGLMSFWWAGSRQQQGRSVITISDLPDLMTIDPRLLTLAQVGAAADIFTQFHDRPFLPANEAYRDQTRQDLDRAVLIDLLGLPASLLDPLSNLRLQWCHEPSVHGGKKTAPSTSER